MTIVEALQILELPVKASLTVKEVKDNYKRLMRGCHPDIHQEMSDEAATNLNTAIDIILPKVKSGELADVLNKFMLVEEYKKHRVDKPTIVITVEQLCKIYAGHTIEIMALDGDVYKLNKGNRSLFKIIISFKVEVDTGDADSSLVEVFRFGYRTNDKYDSALDIEVSDIATNYVAKLSCAGNTVNLNIPNGIKRLALRLKFDYNIVLELTITKKLCA